MNNERTSKRWYVGAMNDAYFVIDAPPRLSTDYVNPAQDVNVIAAMGTDGEAAYRMVAEHNAALADKDS